MTAFATAHTRAASRFSARGAVAVTFSKQGAAFSSPTTGARVPSSSSVSGRAFEGTPNHRLYEALGLTKKRVKTLVFCPDTYGAEPEIGATCTWASETWTVERCLPAAPDGNAIVTEVVVSI